MKTAQRTLDAVIIGQGLAGSQLALSMLAQNKRVMVMDDGWKSASSIVAAGLINPITGHRPQREPHFDVYRDAFQRLYPLWQRQLDADFFDVLPQLRIFRDQEQKSKWHKAHPDITINHLEHPFGSCTIEDTYVVRTDVFLHAARDYFQTHNLYQNQRIAFEDIHTSDDHIEICGHRTSMLVWCDGAKLNENPFFANDLLEPTRGDIITLGVTDALTPKVYNWGKWMIPQKNGDWKLGSTYHHDLSQPHPMQENQEALISSMKHALNIQNCSVVEHKTGIRPTTLDRQPRIKKSSHHPRIYAFNGFGSKGCMKIPFFAHAFSTQTPGEKVSCRFL